MHDNRISMAVVLGLLAYVTSATSFADYVVGAFYALYLAPVLQTVTAERYGGTFEINSGRSFRSFSNRSLSQSA